MGVVSILFLVTIFLTFLFCVIERVQFIAAENSDKQEGALFLTPLLEVNEPSKAQQLSRVYPDIANTTSFTGYFTVDQECESNLFFWFVQAQTNWEKSPVLLWLQGGPGCPSLFGLLKEVGPFFFKGETANVREISWNKNINLLFIDQPVGTGFSFSGKECYATNKTDIARSLYSAIYQFFQLFPLLKENNFYIAGESYAGHYIPYIAHFIHKQNPSAMNKIKLSGLMIGNGWMDSYYQSDYGDFLYSLGLVDEDQKKLLQLYLLKYRHFLNAGDFKNALNLTSELEDKKDEFMLKINPYNYLQDENDAPEYIDFMDFTFLKTVIHVGTNEFSSKKRIMKTVFRNLKYDQLLSVKSEVEELLEHYPIVFYFGQLDTVCPYSLALGFLRKLQWSGAEDYLEAPRRRWCVDGHLAGLYKSSHNLHEVLVRNAGHSVPLYQPLWAFMLADSVTSSPPDDPLQRLKSC